MLEVPLCKYSVKVTRLTGRHERFRSEENCVNTYIFTEPPMSGNIDICMYVHTYEYVNTYANVGA